MAEKCLTCGLGTVTAYECDPVILDKARFLLNDLLTTSQTCYVCGMLYEGILLLPNFHNVQEIEVNKSDGALTPLQVKLRQPGQKVGASYEFYISSMDEPVINSPWPILTVGRDLRSSPEDRIGLVRPCLENCIRTHRNCPSAVQKLPKRVITLDPYSSNIRLKETANGYGQYVALSYCWGQKGNILTTTENIEEMMTDISLDTLPKTIREAVQITRLLGIENLWVDSLCIIQDSKDDWIQQASFMCDIYTDATIVIAVHSGADANSGCFLTDESRNMQLATFSTSINRTTDIKVSIRKSSWSGESSPTHTIKHKPSFLSRRGWTFQEYVLAKRMLHCTSHELGWQCPESYACECRPVYPKEPMLAEFKKLVLGQLSVNGQPLSDDVQHHFELHKSWRNVVNDYTRRKFTVSTDCLPALSGFVTALSRRYPQCFGHDDYVFGMWRGELVRHLLWSTWAFRGPARRLAKEYAPSWAWTSLGNSAYSIGCRRFWSTTGLKTVEPVEVVHVSCTPATENLFGPGTGRISLRGTLQPVRLHWTDSEELSETSEVLRRSGKSIDHISLELDDGSGVEVDPNCQHYFLALIIWSTNDEIHELVNDNVHGILLAPIKETADTFRRVAYAYTKSISTGEDISSWELPPIEERKFDLV
ncbi:HET-domain-containing protein [Stipitochalara longipes BDJ]|nr:HET-domain-containing protein [Stipitochalara longipes BDJ]